MEKNIILSKLKYILIFVIATLTLEVVVFWSLNFGFVPKYILFDFAYIFIISAVLFLMKNRKSKIILISILLLLQVVLNCVNACYYKVLGDVFSFDLLRLGNEAVKAFEPSFIYFEAIILNVLVGTAFILLLVSITKKEQNTKTKIKKFSSLSFIIAIALFFSSFGLSSNYISQCQLEDCAIDDAYYVAKSDLYLYDHFQFKQEAFKKFGTFGFYIKSLENLIVNNTEISQEERRELESFIDEGIVEKNDSAPLKDDNLIVIMLESLDWFAIDPYCTPTLYKLSIGEAQSFTNFRARNKTNVSENIVMLGNTVKETDFMKLSKEKDFKPKNSLAYMFKDNEYTSNYFHSYTGEFYDRNRVNSSFGFEDIFAIEDSNLGTDTTFGSAYLETDFLDSCIDRLAPTENKFFSFYTTFGTHGSYDNFNERYSEYLNFYEEHLPEINTYLTGQGFHIPTNKTYYNRLKEFKCAAMDTDKMISNLFDYLENNNLLDNTTIVLYADHNCYYNDLNLYARYNGKDDYEPTNSDIYNIPFMIYSRKLGGAINNTFCSTYDIYPTICDLFGLSYNKNLTQGYNVFSEEIENSVFVSNLSGIFTDTLYSNNIMGVFDNSKSGASEEKISKFQLNSLKFYDKQSKIDKIYLNKLYNMP